MALQLYSFAGDFRALKALVAAKYNGVAIEQPAFDMDKDTKTPEFLAKSPMGKVPVLDTKDGSIFESNAIARYVARLRRDTELMGASFFDQSKVEQWIDFTAHQVETAATLWVYPILGWLDYKADVEEAAIADLEAALEAIEGHLLKNTYLVGEGITLADIVLACALLYPMKFVLDEEYRVRFPCVTRWFITCVNQPEFASVLGDVPLCQERMVAKGAGKKGGKKGKKGGKQKQKQQPKKQQPKKEKAAAAAPAPAPAKKEKKKGPFDGLPRSSMSMDGLKRHYSNAPRREDGERDYAAAMTSFMTDGSFDKEGFSLWFCSYNYNQENTVGFMTSNLVGGFVQRSDALRKYAFGVMQILNEEKPFEVVGCWIIRGQSIDPMLDANPDAEYYTWTKADSDDAATRAKTVEYFCNEEELEGKKIYDCKLFK